MLDQDKLVRTARQLAVEEWRRIQREQLKPSICPLYDIDGNIPGLCGSGVLLRMQDRHFLLTASHVIEDAKSTLWFAGPDYVEQLHYSIGPRSDQKHWDFAVLELTDAENLSHMARFVFLELKDLDPNDEVREERLYVFCGYPASQNKTKYSAKHIAASVVSFMEMAAPLSSYELLKKQPAGSILVPYTREVIEKDILQPAPDLHGISGGGVWRMGDAEEVAKGRFEHLKLVGLCVQEHPREKLLEGVRIGLVIEAMRHFYPDLALLLPRVTTFKANVREDLGTK